jgi:pimeloyl-ACP methyl ester carboxylesterase
MPLREFNHVKLWYECTGSGEPLVLVHGSWGDHHNWASVVPLLGQHFQVVAYDRRGHSQSESAPGQGSFAEDADDLGALIDDLGLAPAHVVGNSGGAAIALRLAGTRPELFRSLLVHEPPLVGLLDGRSDLEPMLQGFYARIQAVIELLHAGDMEAAARRFVETVAFGPGAWESLPPAVRDTFVRNAPTFLDETNDPDGLGLDVAALRSFDKPALVTTGTASPPFFAPIVEVVARALPRSRTHAFEGAGHVPHLSHPQQYVEVVRRFCSRAGAPEPSAGSSGP